MKRLIIAGSLIFLAACGDDRHTHITTTVAPPPSETTELLIQAQNYDAFDYELWLEYQDSTGVWKQTHLFPLYGDPEVGPTLNYGFFVASPETPYYVLLADIDGTLFDTYILWLPYGSFADVRFQVIDGDLVRPF